MSNEEAKLSLKVMINKENSKVLYAEADSDFADVLLSFLTLPLGKIVPLVDYNYYYEDEDHVFGSLFNLYSDVDYYDNADNSLAEGGKQMLLDPGSSFSYECSKLKINVDDTKPTTKYFICGNGACSRRRSLLVTMYHGKLKCDCGEYMRKPLCIPGPAGIDQDDGGGVFMKKGLLFLITDDLKMAPVGPDSIMQALLNLRVTVTDGAHIRNVSLGYNDILDLLRASLQSSTPLTDVILGIIFCHGSTEFYDSRETLSTHIMDESSMDSRKMIVKAWVRTAGKSENSLHLLEVGGDFVDFLWSFLVIPLGGVEWLLGGDTGLRSIDNLYRSIRDFCDDKCFSVSNLKSRLIKPKLPPYVLSKNHMFPLEEVENPLVCYFERHAIGESNTTEEIISWMHFKDSKGGENYVKSSATFFFDGDLSRSSRKRLNTDTGFKEFELHIGLEEALNILKASLTSGHALDKWFKNLAPEKLHTKS